MFVHMVHFLYCQIFYNLTHYVKHTSVQVIREDHFTFRFLSLRLYPSLPQLKINSQHQSKYILVSVELEQFCFEKAFCIFWSRNNMYAVFIHFQKQLCKFINNQKHYVWVYYSLVPVKKITALLHLFDYIILSCLTPASSVSI